MRLFRAFLLSAWLLSAPVWAGDLGEAPIPGAVQHQVVSGETLGTLSRRYGAAPEVLRNYTGGGPPRPGMVIWVPPPSSGWVIHEVETGQTLEFICRGYQLPVEQVRQANTLESDDLSEGQELKLPRSRKPEWKEPSELAKSGVSAESETEAAPQASSPPPTRPSLSASRSARPKIRSPLAPKPAGKWAQVTLPDGRKGWVRVNDLQFDNPNPAPDSNRTFSFGQKLSQNQKDAILRLVERLANDGFTVEPDDIINFMALETGGTFDPAIRNRNGPVGLAQFTQVAVRDLNQGRPAHDQLSMSRLAAMSFEEQSVVVGDYLSTAFQRKNMQGRTVTAADLYAAIFAPKAIGQPLDSAIYTRGRDHGAYERNRSLDSNKDGSISKREMVKRLDDWARRGENLRG